MVTVPDLFTHALAGLVIAVVLSWRYGWITPPLVAAAMTGAVLPDLNRIELLIPAATIEAATGLTWSWAVLHRAGGTLLVILLLTMFVPRGYMKAVFSMLLVGAASHYLLDYLLWKPSGLSGPLLWPFTDWRLSFDGIYRSSDRWPAVAAMLVAAAVLAIDHWRGQTTESPT